MKNLVQYINESTTYVVNNELNDKLEWKLRKYGPQSIDKNLAEDILKQYKIDTKIKYTDKYTKETYDFKDLCRLAKNIDWWEFYDGWVNDYATDEVHALMNAADTFLDGGSGWLFIGILKVLDCDYDKIMKLVK